MSTPQSNQRGIETRQPRLMEIARLAGLNRTSVGLKPFYPASRWPGLSRLNRTSVGLKPGRPLQQRLEPPQASIEPAWD